MRILRLEGTPEAMGAAYGESCRAQIGELYQKRLHNALSQAKEYGGRTIGEAELLALAQASLPQVAEYSPEGYQELQGISRGSGLPLLKLWMMNALTDLRDVAAFGDPSLWAAEADGCSSFLLMGDSTQDGRVWCGQTWDLVTDNLPHVLVVVRKPKQGPATVSLTTDGCLSLIGMNEHGVAIGTTNIRTVDSRPGVCYLDLIHKALGQKTLAAAADAVENSPRAGAHYFYLSDGEKGVTLECTATRAVRTEVHRGYAVHCNHVLAPEQVALEAQGTPMASSHHRQSRFEQLLAESPRPQIRDLERFLADHQGGNNSICRHNFAGITSNASVLMNPAQREFHAVHGPACCGQWFEVLSWS